MADSNNKTSTPPAERNQRGRGKSASRPLWLGPVAMLGAFLLVFGLIVWLTQQNGLKARRTELVNRTESLGEGLRLRFKGNTDYLLLLAQDRALGKLSPDLFQLRAAQYVKFHPEMLNITWVDADFFIRDVAPREGNSQILGLHLDLPEPRRVSRLAMESRGPVFTRPFEAIQGKASFEVWVPVYRGDRFLGLLAAVYSSERILSQLDSPALRPLYHLSLVDDSGALLAESPWNGAPDKELARSVLITSKESGIYLRLQGYQQGGQDWRLVVLELLCLALVFGMALALWKLKRENEQRRRVEESLHQQSELLTEEIAERQAAQEDLQEQTVVLEEEIAERQAAQEALQEQTVVLEEEIAERLQAADELLQKKTELQSILDSSPALIYLKDCEGHYLFVNRLWAELLGTQNSEVVGKTDLELFPEAAALQFRANDRKALESPEPLELEEEAQLPDGRHLYHSVKVALRDASGSAYALCGISTDITEHMKTQEMLRQSQKLESIGRLAGGVAHDFNNMLSVIIGCAELALHKLNEADPLWLYLKQILRAAERSSEVTRQLLTFSRKELVPAEVVNLNTHILQSERSLGRLIGEDIHKKLQLAPDLWPILIAPSQVDQILMNLSINSRDAMPSGGTLRIETANLRVTDDPGLLRFEAGPGDYVQLTVSDTGSGMDRETAERIFEPFFTTKEVGKGTGLGLATVYGIIRQNGGFITVQSEPAQGTTVRLYFPRYQGEAQEEQLVPGKVVSGTGTVLLVEDDPLVRQMALQMLDQLGYTAVVAETPQHAIEICREGKRKIDLILTDVVMPGMNGKEMVDAIHSFGTPVKVLFMSGYASDLLAQRGVAEEGRHFLHKPFDLQTLNERITEVLAED